MRTAIGALLLLVLPGLAEKTGPTRADLLAIEKNLDNSLSRFYSDNPFNLLGRTRGVYLDGAGAVFTAEITLAPTPGISPFRPEISPEDKVKINQMKQDRLPALRTLMRNFLVSSAASLDRLPPDEQICVGVSLFFFGWEIQTGLPQQVVMSAKKKPLVDVAAGRLDRSQLDTLIKVREF
jgi:hypothetical protein